MSHIKVVYNNIRKSENINGFITGTSFTEFEFNELVKEMIEDSTTGTWIDMHGLSKLGINIDKDLKKFKAKVWNKDAKSGYLILEYPLDNFDFDYAGLPLLLGTIAGDIMSYPKLFSIDLADIYFPQEVLSKFKGPKCGIGGVRALLNVYDRPILAFTAKPRIGLTPGKYAELLVEVAKGGVDIVEDDERLVNPAYCNLTQRVEKVLEAFERHNIKRTIYSVNITGNAHKSIEVADKLINMGVKMLKIDVLPSGFSGLQAVSEYIHEKKVDVPITVYPGMGRIYKNINKRVILKLSRMVGADIIYASTPHMGKYGRHDLTSTSNENEFLIHTAKADIDRVRELHDILTNEESVHNPSLPTVSTSIHPGAIIMLQKALNTNDLAYFVGGSIVAVPEHLGGPKAGAQLCMESINLSLKNKHSYEDFSPDNKKILDYFNEKWDLPSETLLKEISK
jgi:ribulose 1,5-bisphosphate carboxylase large subunit-like protein